MAGALAYCLLLNSTLSCAILYSRDETTTLTTRINWNVALAISINDKLYRKKHSIRAEIFLQGGQRRII